MKSVEIQLPYGVDALRLVDRPEPHGPGRGQVLVRVRAVALNYRDLLVSRGQGRWCPAIGRVPASDAAGEVVAIGPDVKRVRVGDRVISVFLPRWIDGAISPEKVVGALGGATTDGVLSEYVIFDAEGVVVAPEYLTDLEAATLPCAAVTAWHAVTRANTLRPHTTLLIQGTGGVSLFALQFAKAAGARVIATSSSDDKLVRVSALGADGINYRSCEEWDVEVLRMTAGIGVDHVIDIGGAATIARSISAVRYEGIVSVVGLIGGMAASIDLGPLFLKNLRIDGVETGSRRMLESMLCWMAERSLRPIIDRVFPLSEATKAFAHLESGAHMGKVCITL